MLKERNPIRESTPGKNSFTRISKTGLWEKMSKSCPSERVQGWPGNGQKGAAHGDGNMPHIGGDLHYTSVY